MDIKELRKTIATSSNIEWFKTISSVIDFTSYIDYKQEFIGLVSLYEYLNKEIEKWEAHKGDLPEELNYSKVYFLSVRNNIDSLVNSYINNPEGYWRNVLSHLQSTNNNPLPYNNPTTQFILEIFSTYGKEACSGAFKFLIEKSRNGTQKGDIGNILAYEFLMKDDSLLESRRTLEKKSLNQLHKDYEKLILEGTAQVSEHIKNTNDKFIEYTASMDDLTTEKQEIFDTWFNEAGEKKAQLENTYKEVVKLQEPAKEWKDRADELNKEGVMFMRILIGLLLFILVSLFCLVWHLPENIINLFLSNDYSAIIKWSILYITFISFSVYGVKIISRSMLSSFHLARDAKERYTLTSFYLALSKDTTVEKEERLLVMQSLFSRSDSGLLNTDTSPTLPTSIVENILKVAK